MQQSHSHSSLAPSPALPADAQEEQAKGFEALLDKMQKHSSPLKTLSLEFTKETAESGKSFVLENIFKAKIDIEKTRAFVENVWFSNATSSKGEIFETETNTISYIDKKISTCLYTHRIKGWPNRDDPGATISKTGIGHLPFEIEKILKFNSPDDGVRDSSFGPKLTFFSLGPLPFILAEKKNISYEGEPALQFSAPSKFGEKKDRRVLIFSKKTGLLLVKERYEEKKKDDKIVEERLWSETYSGYFSHNGVFFPSMILRAMSDGSKRRIKIKKETVRINEPIDEKEFIPKFPSNTRVRDEIRDIEYTTPAVGNLEPGMASEKELDAFLEKTSL